MKKTILTLLVLLFSGQALAETYVLHSANWQNVTGNYNTSMVFSGSFTTAAPLPANLVNWPIGPLGNNLVTAWNFTDGQTIFTESNSGEWGALEDNFSVSTDAQGNMTLLNVILGNPASGVMVNDLVNGVAYQEQKISDFQVGVFAGAIYQSNCDSVTDGICGSALGDPNSANLQLFLDAANPDTPVPVNSPWALVLMILLFGATGWLFRRRFI